MEQTWDYSQVGPVRRQAGTRSSLAHTPGLALWRKLKISCQWGRSRGAGLIRPIWPPRSWPCTIGLRRWSLHRWRQKKERRTESGDGHVRPAAEPFPSEAGACEPIVPVVAGNPSLERRRFEEKPWLLNNAAVSVIVPVVVSHMAFVLFPPTW